MVNLKELPAIVLLLGLLGVLVGITLTVNDSLGDTQQTNTTVTDEQVAVASGAGTLTYDEVTAVTWFANSTNYGQNYTLTKNVNYTEGSTALILGVADDTYNITYSYRYDSDVAEALDNVNTAIGDIPEDWLLIVITVIVMAIILGIVLTGFGSTQRR